jgi:epoxyqueuosine reductase
MGNWTFGCDLCQMVCPWNRFAEKEYDQSFAPYPDLPSPELIAVMSLTPQEFNRKFKDNPVRRARRDGYLRNTAIALGNSESTAGFPALEGALQAGAPLVRQHAEWAIKQIRKIR